MTVLSKPESGLKHHVSFLFPTQISETNLTMTTVTSTTVQSDSDSMSSTTVSLKPKDSRRSQSKSSISASRSASSSSSSSYSSEFSDPFSYVGFHLFSNSAESRAQAELDQLEREINNTIRDSDSEELDDNDIDSDNLQDSVNNHPTTITNSDSESQSLTPYTFLQYLENSESRILKTCFQLLLTSGLNAATMHSFMNLLGTTSTSGLGPIGPLSLCCVPIVAPFNTPPVHYSSWCQNKRACAFQRSLMFLSIAQSVLAMAKFFSGNLIGGFFDMMISGTGVYAASADGHSMLSTYVVFAGFNGVMDLLQLIQHYHGVLPLYKLPFQPPALRPLLLLLGCYFTYEFHKELVAIFQGYDGYGSKDTYFVQLMSAEFWGPPPGCSAAEERRRALQNEQQNSFGNRASRIQDTSSANNGNDSNINGGSGMASAFNQISQNWGSGTTGGGSGNGGGGAGDGPNRPSNFAPFGGEGRRLGNEQVGVGSGGN